MRTIVVKLKDLTLEPGHDVDLASLAPAEASRRIRESFGFLADTVDVSIEGESAVIRFPEPDPARIQQAAESFQRGVKDARKGDYGKAIKYLRRALAVLPDHVDARRNLAMAYLEQGDAPKAKEHLLECMRLNPEDSWTYVLLGNIATKHDRALDTAEFFYEKGLSIAPGDNYLLNNYAGLLLEQGKLERARELFGRALAVDPAYPNTYLGLAMVERKEGHFEDGLSRLREMFFRPPSEDIRSRSVYERGRILYLDLSQELADSRRHEMMAAVLARKASLERDLGIPIQVLQDESLQNAMASAQAAWRHHRAEHRILIRPGGEANAHLVAHEMEHIVLEHEARKAGKNRSFLTTAGSRELAIRSSGDHIEVLARQGYPEQSIGAVIQQMTQGLCSQLYNCPLDMYVESRLVSGFKEIEACQFSSLHRIYEESLRVATDKEIRKLTPSKLYHASVSMNCATALFLDHLFGMRTDYSSPYRSTEAFETGRKLFELWRSQEAGRNPGDEYLLVDQFAETLGLREWYEWKPDADGESKPDPGTERTKFDGRQSEALMFCLDALRRFDGLSPEATSKATAEIALLGSGGVDYTTPDRFYEVQAFPGERFTGFHLLCLLHVGLRSMNPTLETGLDLDGAYKLALDAYHKRLQ